MILKDLGIVILNYNSYDSTNKCIKSIINHYNDTLSIVIVDNCSTDNSYEQLRKIVDNHDNIDLIKTDYNGGYSYGNNSGIKHIINNKDLKYISIINPDVEILDNNIFQILMMQLEKDSELAAISPLMILDNKIKPERWAIKQPRNIQNFLSSFSILKSVNPLTYKTYHIIKDKLLAYVDVIPGSFLMIKINIFSDINYFDESVFLYGEEIILGKKLKNRNLKLGLSFEVFYRHYHSPVKSSFRLNIFHLFYSLKSHIYYNSKYHSKLWGVIDSFLVIAFSPLRLIETIVLQILINLRSRKTK